MSPSRSAPSTVNANTIASSLLSVETRGAGFIDITSEVAKFLREAGAREGAVTLFIRHTSASLTIQENADPSVLKDLTTALSRLAPENAGWVHDTEGPDDMPAHIKTMLTSISLQIPVLERRDGARHLAGHLCGRASRAAAPARDRAAVHRDRHRLDTKKTGRGSLRGRLCSCHQSERRRITW